VSRILAVDWGARRVGLAVSDPLGVLASALPTLEVRSEADAVARVAEVARETEAESIVVGLPLTLAGERGEAALAAERFAGLLREATALPVDLFDERLTSVIAQRRLHETGTKTRGHKGRLDAGAAVALLEGWLARLAQQRRDAGGA
jgi:putative Holliday junction resolvase